MPIGQPFMYLMPLLWLANEVTLGRQDLYHKHVTGENEPVVIQTSVVNTGTVMNPTFCFHLVMS